MRVPINVVTIFNQDPSKQCEVLTANYEAIAMPKALPQMRERFSFIQSIKLSSSYQLTVDGRSGERDRSRFACCQIEGEVVSIALVHHFHTQVGAVQDVCPGTHYTTL